MREKTVTLKLTASEFSELFYALASKMKAVDQGEYSFGHAGFAEKEEQQSWSQALAALSKKLERAAVKSDVNY